MKQTSKTYKKHGAIKAVVTFCFLTFFAWGCDSESASNPESLSFTGNWVIYEAWQGCEASGEDEIPIEITRNGAAATLTVAGQSIECNVIDQTLKCIGQLDGKNGSVHDYTDLTLWFDDNRKLSGEAGWTLYKESGATCSGTSTISSSPTADSASTDDGAIQIKNSTLEQFRLLNIVPCEVSFSPWGPNQLLEGNTLEPDQAHQITSIPEGCYSVRLCREIDPFDNSNCIVYHQNVYVENSAVYTIVLGAD